MTVSPLSELTRLPERQAVQRFFDGVNRSVLRPLLAVATPGAVAGVIVGASTGSWVPTSLWALALAVDLLLIFGKRKRFVVESARQLLIAFLITHLWAVVGSAAADPEPAYVFTGYIFPAALMFFRLRWLEYLSLQSFFLAAGAWFATREGMPPTTGARTGLIVGMVVCALIVNAIALRVTRRRRAAFLEEWRREVTREREESRMRGELMDAREIQLSMLPRSTPELDWIDSSGLSIPASEVGGDYYEYFQIDADRLALVIGDVAGHGVASGLVLSGVRSGLHLLREELVRPVEVIERLNRMVRETAPRRMFVTLQIALLDRRSATVTLANAGHPPLLLMAADDRAVTPVGPSGLPLGTRLDARYREVRRDLAPCDTLVFYTDGVLETSDLEGSEFGEQRLAAEVHKARAGATARQIRDSIVSELSRFRGDAVQVDDVTLVVLRVGSLSPGG